MTTTRPDENCPYCGLPDEADREMVQCDRCDVWYHFRCAGVTRAVKHQSWFCGPCQAERHYGPNPELNPAGSEEDNFSVPPSELSSLRSHTSSSIRQGLQLLDEQFQVRQKRLAEEKAMQERRLALEEEYAKQQNDLREEHLKVRQELLSSLRDMSVSGSRGSARSRASAVRSERVRQWMDKQQNPVENPRKVDPRGAFPDIKPAQDVSPLRNPNMPQQGEKASKIDGTVRDSQEKEKKEKLGNIGRESHVETTAELIGTASEINLRPTQTAHLRC
ncbi:hypothetical protein quinque_010527 [Culex quinquefasciatus]